MRWQATKALMLPEFTSEEHKRHPTAARAEQRSWDAAPNEEHSLLQANESRPDGPAEL